jgi:hypothetical protein
MEKGYLLLNEMVQRLSYKPGYTFSVRRVENDRAMVSLTCPSLPNSREGDNTVGLTINNVIKLATIVTPSDALQAFASVIARFELHEAAEFFQCDGRTVFLPHARGDDFGNFMWPDFINLGGKYLRAVQDFLRKLKAVQVDLGEGTRQG